MRRYALITLLLLLAPLDALGVSPLAGHPSPYLAMHADDPVHWQLWGEPVLKRAQREHRLIFLSSGYFACHWCHVMQQESFRNAAIAERLNRDFIPVKIDRELWPELDATLIEFVERTRGSAGWPLSVFLTPEGHPLVGTTYLPPERFDDYLRRLQQRWDQDAENLSALAAAAATEADSPEGAPMSAQTLEEALHDALLPAWEREADRLAGGFGSGAKFPQVPLMKSLFGVAQEGEVAAFLTLTLEQMADNGLRDHLGGGFFRYTVDPAWQEPHFEKMLSDNAQLASLYLEAARVMKRESFQHIGQETLDFILREMRHPAGGFISALSAVDDDGVEGGYYLWNDADLKVALRGDDIDLARQVWGLSGGAHWERGYLPLPQPSLDGVDTTKRVALKRQLWLQRNKRMLPRDEKRLAAANALTLIALSEAYGLSGRYVTAGNDVRDYLHRLWDGKRLWRMLDLDGTRWLPAGLEEYAYTALALLKWDAVANDEQSRKLAARLVAASWQRFYGEKGWLPGGESTLVGQRQALLPGGARPSPVVALFEANLLLGERAPVSRQAMAAALTAAPQRMLTDPLAYSGYLKLLRQLSDE